MPSFELRVWLPDRPGALGAIASRIGAVRGDVVGIDILERGAGRAIDELIVELPDAGLVPLLVHEVNQVDGVDVEDVRPLADMLHDPRLDALETAALLMEETAVDGLLHAFVHHAQHDFEAEWAVVVDLAGPVPLALAGDPPGTAWLEAFIAGSRTSIDAGALDHGPDDVAWSHLADADLALVLGRTNRPFRARERRQLIALARIVDQRWVELVAQAARASHPSSSQRAS
jgi:hypothetical protein